MTHNPAEALREAYSAADDHKEIWLEPKCSDVCGDGRSWCQDDVWEKCDECGSPAVKYIRADLAALTSPAPAGGEPFDLDTVREQVKEGKAAGLGFWQTCTGCHESEDGYDNGHYPFSPAFDCKLGSGCSECGGIGAIWDTTNYKDLVKFSLEQEAAVKASPAPSPSPDVAGVVERLRAFADDYVETSEIAKLMNEAATLLESLS